MEDFKTFLRPLERQNFIFVFFWNSFLKSRISDLKTLHPYCLELSLENSSFTIIKKLNRFQKVVNISNVKNVPNKHDNRAVFFTQLLTRHDVMHLKQIFHSHLSLGDASPSLLQGWVRLPDPEFVEIWHQHCGYPFRYGYIMDIYGYIIVWRAR